MTSSDDFDPPSQVLPPSPPRPPPTHLSRTFLHIADLLADHIALQCFLLASSDCKGLVPTRGFLLTGPPGTGKSSVVNHVAQRLAHSHQARIVPISAVAGVKFYAKDDNLLKSFVRKNVSIDNDDATVVGEPSSPILLILDDLADVASYESLESARTLFLADLARVLNALPPTLPIAVLASVTDSSANPKPTLFTFVQTLPEISEPIRYEIMDTILSSLKGSINFNAADMPTQSPDGDLATFAAHIAALTPGYTPRDLTLVARQLVFLATSNAPHSSTPPTPDTLAADLASTLVLTPTFTAAHVRTALARVRPSLAVSQQYARPVPRVTWADVHGYAEVVDELKAAVVWPLRDPLGYARVGARAPRGVLLYGPPGCGKTLLVHALASEPGVNVVSVKGPELLSKYFGESESRLRSLFTQARKSGPCVLFFDEMDVLGVKRSFSTSTSSSSVNERVLSTLLNEMDGVSTGDGVVVVGCTSRPWDMDDALLRPGRLDRLVYVGLPKEVDRLAVLKGVGTKWAQGVDLERVAQRAVGVSGGKLKVLVREAGIKAMAKNGPAVQSVAWDDLMEAAREMGVPLESENEHDGGEQSGEVGWEDVDEAFISVRQQLMVLEKRAKEVDAPYVQFRNLRSAK
ncbi:P-loop containing nucleoside triphosphate hydrolase protein [Catenaria anguillulae PL171]|uniref:p-loop containing nucleoside triphosphate hydrolase protein n=1 Tax=Catenaria anguillulae PL171 TaxID=765915 RepID=A0A1Y2I594_9FUNG|nr:P-loop containing nucleoside triphosphate hydrolase protein [Catenaria anguillulae PL171]